MLPRLGFTYKKQFYKSYTEQGKKKYKPIIPEGKHYESLAESFIIKKTGVIITKKIELSQSDLRGHLNYFINYRTSDLYGKLYSYANNKLNLDHEESLLYADHELKENKIYGSCRDPNSNIFIIDGDNKQNLSYEYGLRALYKTLTIIQEKYNITPALTEISPRGTFHIYYHSKLDKKKLVDYLNSETDDRINIEILSPNQNFRFPLSHDYYPIKYDKFLECDQEDFWNLTNARYESFVDFFESICLAEQTAITQKEVVIEKPVVIKEVTPEKASYLPLYSRNTGSINRQWILNNPDLDITQGNRYRTQASIFAYAKHAGINNHEEIIDICIQKLISSKDVEKHGHGWWKEELREAFKSLEKGFIPSTKKYTKTEFVSSLHILSEDESKALDSVISEYINKNTLKYYPDLPIVLKECLAKIIYEFQNKREINSKHKNLLNEKMIEGIETLPDLPCIFFDRMKTHYNLKADGYTYRNLILSPARKMEGEVGVLSLRLFDRFMISSRRTTWVNGKDWGYTQRLTSEFVFPIGASVSDCVQKVVGVLISKVYRKCRELGQRVSEAWSSLRKQSLSYIPKEFDGLEGTGVEMPLQSLYFDPVPDG